MAEPVQPVAGDTNILFSALLRSRSRFSDILLQPEHSFYVCESVLVELFRHKEKILRLSRVADDDLARFYHILLRRVTVYKEDLISPARWREAHALCREVDEADTPHVALALELDGLLWTGDRVLREGLSKRGFTRFFHPGEPDSMVDVAE